MNKGKSLSLFPLSLLTGYASMAAMIVTPALNDIADFFYLPSHQAALLVSVFLAGYTMGQWLYGPITQRYGRKPALQLGVVICLLGCLLSLLSTYHHMTGLLLLGRFIQALGSSAGLVVSLAMIHDVFRGVEARRAIALVTMAFAIFPGLAVVVGGLLLTVFPWQSGFISIMLYSFAMIVVIWRLPETSRRLQPDAFSLANLFGRYGRLLLNRPTVSYSAMWGCCTVVIYVLAAVLPLWLIGELSYSATEFSLAFLSTSVGLLSGNLLSAYLARRCPAHQVMAAGIALFVLGAFLLLAVMLAELVSLLSVFACLFWLYLGLPMIFSNAAMMAAAQAEDKTTASSLAAMINLGMAAIGSFFFESLALPLPQLVLLLLFTIPVCLVLLLRR